MIYYAHLFLGGYFPFVLMAFHLITGESIYSDLYGLAVGHSYVFLKDIYPISSGRNFLRTPKLLYLLLKTVLKYSNSFF